MQVEAIGGHREEDRMRDFELMQCAVFCFVLFF